MIKLDATGTIDVLQEGRRKNPATRSSRKAIELLFRQLRKMVI